MTSTITITQKITKFPSPAGAMKHDNEDRGKGREERNGRGGEERKGGRKIVNETKK